ncbi:MAG: hypothetical protein AAGI01_01600, partial [Myxococcota bacterium]
MKTAMFVMVAVYVGCVPLTGCASKPQEKSFWPSEAEVTELLNQPLVKVGRKSSRPKTFASWTYTSPPAEYLGMEELAVADTVTRWLFTEIGEQKEYRATKQARCLAEEVTAYSLEHGYEPPREFEYFAAQHCGIMETRRARAFHVDFELNDISARSDTELLDFISDGMAPLISVDVDDTFVEIGLVVRQKGQRVVAVFTAIAHDYTIEPI